MLSFRRAAGLFVVDLFLFVLSLCAGDGGC